MYKNNLTDRILLLEISEINKEEIKTLLKEAEEILAIIIASINTARKNKPRTSNF